MLEKGTELLRVLLLSIKTFFLSFWVRTFYRGMASEMLWKFTGDSISICHTAVRVVKQVLLSVGIISTLFLLNPALKISSTFNLLCCSIPSFFVWFRSWLSPRYPFITVIFILILILLIVLASSSSPPSSSFLEEFKLDYSSEEVWSEVSGEETPAKTSDSGRKCIAGEKAGKLESTAVVAGKNESLEKIWKALMEEHGIPAARQLKKCETWNKNDGGSLPRKEMRKSNTFAEARSSFRETHPFPRKDEFLSQDELNTKVEDFIRKCRNKMRLERLESDQRFMDILNRGL